MNYQIVFTEIFAGCLFAAAAAAFRVRLEKVRSLGLRVKVGRHNLLQLPSRPNRRN